MVADCKLLHKINIAVIGSLICYGKKPPVDKMDIAPFYCRFGKSGIDLLNVPMEVSFANFDIVWILVAGSLESPDQRFVSPRCHEEKTIPFVKQRIAIFIGDSTLQSNGNIPD